MCSDIHGILRICMYISIGNGSFKIHVWEPKQRYWSFCFFCFGIYPVFSKMEFLWYANWLWSKNSLLDGWIGLQQNSFPVSKIASAWKNLCCISFPCLALSLFQVRIAPKLRTPEPSIYRRLNDSTSPVSVTHFLGIFVAEV